MAEKLLPAGYDIFTVDIQWYEPGATGFEYRTGVELAMDGHGRLLPAPNRFPSATGGAGFRPLADLAHALGLPFGIHLKRDRKSVGWGKGVAVRVDLGGRRTI